MVHYSRVIAGITAFMNQDLLTKLKGSWKAWGLGTIIGLLSAKGNEAFESVRNNAIAKTLGLIDGEMINVEAIYTELIKQAQLSPATVEFPLIGTITYSVSDVETLYKTIMGA